MFVIGATVQVSLRGPSLPGKAWPGDNRSMKVLYFLADVFINTFGITRPSEKARTQAAFFILGLIVLLLAGVTAAGLAIYAVMH